MLKPTRGAIVILLALLFLEALCDDRPIDNLNGR
jgi:hypothetical protein